MAASTMGVTFLLTVVLSAAPANAESILFSSLGPDDAFDRTSGSFFGFDEGQEDTPDHHFARAVPFSPSSTATLRSIDIALDFLRFNSGTLVINLFAGEGGLPGPLLETFTRAERLEPAVHSFRSAGRPALEASRSYFIEATTIGREAGTWYWSSEEGEGTVYVFRADNGPWRTGVLDTTPAFRVTGDVAPIPEPASLILLGAAFAIVPVRRRLSRSPVVLRPVGSDPDRT